MLGFPILVSPSTGDRHQNSVPFATVAIAGHATSGGGAYCECGTPGCREDYPGECDNQATQQSDSPSDASAELGILIVALLLLFRLKA
jgi:hypothetical protein